MGYTKEWWDKNRALVNERRNEKYQNDPTYREAARARAKEYRDRKRAEAKAAKPKPTLEVNGNTVKALTTAQVCKHAGVTASRIKYMQRAGYLPTALVTRPVRIYTKVQADLIKDLEAFLRLHQDRLRGPTTPESAEASKKLNAKTTKIATKWET